MDNNITNSNIIKEKCFSPYTENTKSFDIILVKPNKIGDIDYNNIYYLNQILSCARSVDSDGGQWLWYILVED